MLTKPPAAAAAKGAPAEVTVSTTSPCREQKPELDEVLFEEAVQLALAEAAPEGYPLLVFKGVTEFVTHQPWSNSIEYRYMWVFDAHAEA